MKTKRRRNEIEELAQQIDEHAGTAQGEDAASTVLRGNRSGVGLSA